MPLRELLSRGIITESEIVDGDLLFHPVHGRNRNLTIERPADRSYFVKLPPAAPAPDRLPVEADAYRRLAHAGLVPTWVVESFPCGDDRLLALEFLPGASDLARRHASGRPVPTGFARAAGLAVGSVRRVVVSDDVPETRPWTWMLSAPDHRVFGDLSLGNLELLAALQADPQLSDSLASFRDDWDGTHFIHGDVRLANLVVSTPPGRPPRLALVDWEFAGRGDPRWDIGCLLAEYLGVWLMSLPLLVDATDADLVERAGSQRAAVTLAISAAWEGFRSAAPGAPPLAECVRATGVALVQNAFVLGQGDAAPRTHVLHHLQCAANVLADPERAAVELLGLDGSGEPAA